MLSHVVGVGSDCFNLFDLTHVTLVMSRCYGALS